MEYYSLIKLAEAFGNEFDIKVRQEYKLWNASDIVINHDWCVVWKKAEISEIISITALEI